MELLVVMVIMFVVLGAIYTVWFGLQRTYSFTDDDLTAQRQAQTALSEMVESVRTARLPVSGDTSNYLYLVIVRASRNELICWTDIDRDSQHKLELVRYHIAADASGEVNLYRDNYGNSYATRHLASYAQIVAAHSSAQEVVISRWLSDRYLLPDTDADHLELFRYPAGLGPADTSASPSPPETLPWTNGRVTDPTLIRQIQLDLFIDVRTESRPIAHELPSIVQPRNLRQY
jgi:hypothetical protein